MNLLPTSAFARYRTTVSSALAEPSIRHVPVALVFVVSAVLCHFLSISTWIEILIPGCFGLSEPYKEIIGSVVLGVCCTANESVLVAPTAGDRFTWAIRTPIMLAASAVLMR